MINVTKSFLPPIEDYIGYLHGIWDRGQLTNAGPLVLELEAELRRYLGARHVLVVNNGTIALQLAIRALRMEGEVLTTPFSFIATSSTLVWERCAPVFVDIDPATLTLDPDRLEEKITPRTTGILATHVYGNACDISGIQRIADRHGLRVVYDAAHAFGAEYQGRSLCGYGDVSTISFHATKLFHSGEGGALVTDDDDLAERLSLMRNFGFAGVDNIVGLGINAKSSELHAALGLCVLPHVGELIARRRELSARYDDQFAGAEPDIARPRLRTGLAYNYAYYPILLPTEEDLIRVVQTLRSNGVNSRRYFYPSLNTLPFLGRADALPVSEDIASRVLCLPLYDDLPFESVDRICGLVVAELRSASAAQAQS